MIRTASHRPKAQHAAVALVACGAAVLALAAPASGAGTHRCTPAEPSFTALVASAQVSCSEARALNRYMTTHETLSGPFRLHGETWRGAVYSRGRDRTGMVYRHGRQTVWLIYGAAAS